MRGAKNSQEAEDWANQEEEEEALARTLQIAGLSPAIQLMCLTAFCFLPAPSAARPLDSPSRPRQR